MNKKIRLSIFLLVLVVVEGCKTKQNIPSAEVRDTVLHAETETITEKSDSLKNKKLDYTWISYRANANVSNNSELNNFNVFVVNRKDSIIYTALSKFGIEGARLVLTPDSVKFLNHLTSEYYVGNYAILEQLVGLKADFYTVQSLLLGEELPENLKSAVQASYGNFTTINSQSFFQQADFVILKDDLRVNLVLKNIKLNEQGPTSIRIPEKYMPMKMNDKK